MKAIPPVVDEDGNINVHGRQGAVITINFTDDTGAPRDMSGVSVTFECGPVVNVNLSTGSTHDEMTLTLSNDDIKAIFGQSNRDFVVLDHSGSVPLPVWVGTVYVTGWVE